jgi:hypothetical protein
MTTANTLDKVTPYESTAFSVSRKKGIIKKP